MVQKNIQTLDLIAMMDNKIVAMVAMRKHQLILTLVEENKIKNH